MSTDPYARLLAIAMGDRANQRGSQAISTITGLQGILDGVPYIAQYQRLLSKLDDAQEDAVVVCAGDSTSDAPTPSDSGQDCFYRWGLLVAAAYPAWTVKYTSWIVAHQAYEGEIIIQVGTGSRILELRNASVAGTSANFHTGDDFYGVFTQVTPDLIWVNYSKNGGTEATRQLTYFNPLAYALSNKLGDVPVIMMGQCPNLTGTEISQKIRVLQAHAGRFNWGFININDAFLQSGIPLSSLLADSLHPNALGSALWALTLFTPMIAGRTLGGPGTLTNGYLLRTYSAIGDFGSWTTSNTSIALNTTNYQTKGYSTDLTNTPGSIGWIVVTAITSSDAISLQNKWITVTAWQRVPTGNTVGSGRIDIQDDAGTTTASGTVQGTGFAPFSCVRKIDPAATFVKIYIYPSDSTTSNTISLDRVTIATGLQTIDSQPSLGFYTRSLRVEGAGANGIGNLYNATTTGAGFRWFNSVNPASTAWMSDFAPDGVFVKTSGDTAAKYSVRQNGFFVGDGTGTATMRIAFVFSNAIGPNAHWDPSTNATFDVGQNGAAWRNFFATTGYRVNNIQVVGAQQAAITAPVGGATIDAEGRVAINAIRAALSAHGLTA